jgi:hypothetical protein
MCTDSYPGFYQILSDTKELQKEINSLSGKLDRTFAVTDELVFKVWSRLASGRVEAGLSCCLPLCESFRCTVAWGLALLCGG